jgi:hypothetical protein
MTMDREPTLRETAAELVTEVRALTKRVEGLDQSISRGRHIILTVIVALAFDLALTFGFFYVARTNREAIRAACVSANDTRASDLAMWEGLLGVFPPATTVEGKARVDAIRSLARETFRAHDC